MRQIPMLLAVVALSALPSFATARADETGSMMADAARRFIAALDEKQKSQATFSFDSPERFNWHWIPRERKGVPIKNLTSEQRPLAFGLLSTGLSTKGLLKASTIMSLEEILRVEEAGRGPIRDPELYYVSVFGTPTNEGEWGWRIEGHHLSLNYTLRSGKVVAVTPFQFGSNPALVKSGPRKGVRNLAAIDAPANELFLSLTPEQRKLAIVRDVAPEVTTTPNSAQPEEAAREGIPVAQLTTAQHDVLTRLLHAYAENFPDPARSELIDRIDRGVADAHFAWYGPADAASNHAFRVQALTFLIDFNNTQNGTNHIHTFFRSVGGDFGQMATR